MSGLLNLRTADRLWHGGAEIGEAWLGGQRVWKKPDPLARYWGTGPGQISLDARFDEPSKVTVDPDGRVSAVRDDASGLLMTASGTSRPAWDEGARLVRFANPHALTLQAPVELAGSHILLAVRLAPQAQGANTNLFTHATSGNGLQFFIPTSGPRWRFINGSFTHYPAAGPASLYGSWVLVEYRYNDGVGNLIVNGLVVSSQSGAIVSTLATLIRGPWSAAGAAAQGRIVKATCAAGYNAASPEPAVLAARVLLANRYGVTLG